MENSNKSRKPRRKSMPRGETKSEILLYVADKPDETSTPDIKKHLREKLRLKNKKNLLLHLSDLVGEGLLHKKPFRHGYADTFYFAKNLGNLSNLYDYFRGMEKEDDFMRTAYFQDFISSEDFRKQYLIYLVRNTILNAVGNAQLEGSIIAFFARAFHLGDERRIGKILNELKAYDFSKAKYQKIADLEEVFRLYGGKRKDIRQLLINLIAILKSADEDELFAYIANYGSNRFHIEKATNALMPKGERSELVVMLKSSPSAVEFLLDPKDALEVFIGIPLRNLINDDKKLDDLVASTEKKPDYFRFFDLLSDSSSAENKSPFYTAISSCFMSDYFKKNLVDQEKDQDQFRRMIENALHQKW